MRLDIDSHAAGFMRAPGIDSTTRPPRNSTASDFDPRLRELVRIRASQLNGCAYCIDMHTKDARAIGETEQRIYALPAWRETPYFSDRERAALAFTEAVTLARRQPRTDAAYDAVAAELSPTQEIAALVSLIVTINAWNAIGVSTRAWQPGHAQRDDVHQRPRTSRLHLGRGLESEGLRDAAVGAGRRRQLRGPLGSARSTPGAMQGTSAGCRRSSPTA